MRLTRDDDGLASAEESRFPKLGRFLAIIIAQCFLGWLFLILSQVQFILNGVLYHHPCIVEEDHGQSVQIIHGTGSCLNNDAFSCPTD